MHVTVNLMQEYFIHIESVQFDADNWDPIFVLPLPKFQSTISHTVSVFAVILLTFQLTNDLMNGWMSHGWTHVRCSFPDAMVPPLVVPQHQRRLTLDQEVALCLVFLVCVFLLYFALGKHLFILLISYIWTNLNQY